MSSSDNSDKLHENGYLRRPSFSRQMRKSITKVKESIQKMAEFDIIDDEGSLRAVPEDLNVLVKQTGFSKKEICKLYRDFKQYCPSGALTTSDFRPIYAKLFPIGDSRRYAHIVFNSLDEDKDGIVGFNEFVLVLSSILKGNVEEKLSWIFRLYDLNGDGYISRQEMTIIIMATYEMVEKNQTKMDYNVRVNQVFHKMDLNRDGVISRDEFFTSCKKDDMISKQLSMFDNAF